MRFRKKAYNACQLVILMADGFDAYLKQRLVDAAIGRRKLRQGGNRGDIPGDAVTQLDERGTVFRVQGSTGATHDVDLTVGWCSCVQGNSGGVCKHQVACAEVSMTALPQVSAWSKETRHWLATVALGRDAAPPVEFFAGITETTVEPVEDEESREECAATAAGETLDSDADGSSDDFVGEPPATTPGPATKPSSEVVEELLSFFRTTIMNLGDGLTDQAAKRMTHRMKGLRTSAALNSAIHTFASDASTRARGGARIKCQPTSVSRRAPGTSRGAAPVGSGRPPKALSQRVKKRKRSLSQNVRLNQANAKPHGAGH